LRRRLRASMADIFEISSASHGRPAASAQWPRARLRSALQYGDYAQELHRQAATLKLPTSATASLCRSGAKKAPGKGAPPARQDACARSRDFRDRANLPTSRGGEIIENPCPSCAGSAARRWSARSPSMCRRASRRHPDPPRGEARLACGRPAGDLYIFLSVKPHAFFQRDGADLYCRVPISMVRAPSRRDKRHAIDSSECKLKVPEARNRRQLKSRARNAGAARTRPGRFACQISVETPQNLTKRQRELLHEFEQESSHHTHPESTGFFARMKELFGK